MFEQFVNWEWVCQCCGGSDSTAVLAGLCEQGRVSELVRAHSVKCNGCDGNARPSLRVRELGCSDADWERTKEGAKNRAASIHPKEPVLFTTAESQFSQSWLREQLSGEPRWDDWVRASRYVR